MNLKKIKKNQINKNEKFKKNLNIIFNFIIKNKIYTLIQFLIKFFVIIIKNLILEINNYPRIKKFFLN